MLLRHIPTAIAGRETVGVTPSVGRYFLLQALFHAVGRLLGNHTAYGIGNEYLHHVALLLQLVLEILVLTACRGHEKGVGTGAAQLVSDDATYGKVLAHQLKCVRGERVCALGNEETEARTEEKTNLLHQCLHLGLHVVAGQLVAIAHLLVYLRQTDAQLVVVQRGLIHVL